MIRLVTTRSDIRMRPRLIILAISYGAIDGKQRETIHKIYESPGSCVKDFRNLLDKVDKQFMMLKQTKITDPQNLWSFLEWLIASSIPTKTSFLLV